MKQLKVHNALAAEYVTVGSYGKHVIINVYTGDIQVSDFPAMVPLGFYIEIEASKIGPFEIAIEVWVGPSRVAVLNAEADVEKGRLGVIALPQMQAHITEPSQIKLVAEASDHRKTILKTFKVIQGPLPPG